MDEVIHLAGPVITVGSVQRQRCAWCGALIDERDLARMAVAVDVTASEEVQSEEARRTAELKWEGLVAVGGTNPVVRWRVDDPEDGIAPARSCMKLDDEVTR